MEERAALLEHYLPVRPAFAPEEVSPAALSGYIGFRISSIVNLYWFGIGDHVRSELCDIVHWMEERSLPSPDRWREGGAHHRDAHTSHFLWWKSLGLAKWLLGNGGATEFSRAVRIEWEGWSLATPSEAREDQGNRQDIVGERLAVALCANEPRYGLHFHKATPPRKPPLLGQPMLDFGVWASTSLDRGKPRDGAFVAKGQDALCATLLTYFWPSVAWVEATLWLKAIYFDSGVSSTAQDAIFRAYDCMPGVPRPDFAPG